MQERKITLNLEGALYGDSPQEVDPDHTVAILNKKKRKELANTQFQVNVNESP